MKTDAIGAHSIARIGNFTIHMDTMYLSWLVMAILVLGAWLITRRLERKPGLAQNVLEATVEFIQNLLRENMAPAGQSAFPYIATLFLFILFANLMVIPNLASHALRSPTNDLNVTLGLALVVFILTFAYGVRAHGLRNYLRSFLVPNIFFLPLNILEALTRPITLAFRLFGNIFAGEVLIVILGHLLPLVIPSLWAAFSVFIGVVQAFLFAMLAIAYISTAVEEEL